MRGALARGGESDAPAHVAAWVAAMVYAANPNLIYMQTTAMGESLYLALFIWAMVYFSEFWQGEHAALMKCGLCLMAACLTRYDGWVLAAAMAAAVIVRSSMGWEEIGRGALIRFVLLVAAGPALWLAYNGMVYGNPLEFENGPYSAKAIEQRTQGAGNPGHPGTGNPVVAGLYFVKAAEENVAANHWLQRAWILLAVAGMAWGGYLRWSKVDNKIPTFRANHAREIGHPVLLFWLLIVPVLFYALSVAYGGVPIFVPSWWPFTHYNVRYGLQMLPGFAAAIGVVVWFVVRSGVLHWRTRLGAVLALVAFVGVSYASVWRAGPICLSEAEINMRSRNQLEAQVASWLGKLPQDSTLLMYLGDHVGALQRAGIPLKQVINEGNHRVWKRPADPDGLWERALADPSRYADYVVAFEGGPVWQAVHGMHLPEIVEIHVSGQAAAIICRAR